MKLFIFVTQILKIRQMKKIIIVLAIVNFVFTSCGNSNSTNKETELELRERELKHANRYYRRSRWIHKCKKWNEQDCTNYR